MNHQHQPDFLPTLRANSSSGLPAQFPDAAPFPSPRTPSQEPGLDWRRYVAAVIRYRWLVLVVLFLGTGAGALATRFVEPTYVAEATILVPERGAQGGPIQPEALFTNVGWMELIKTSFIVLDNVVRDLHLYVQPASPEDSAAFSTFGLKPLFQHGRYALRIADDGGTFELRAEGVPAVHRGTVGDSIGPDLGFLWVPPAGSLRPGRTMEFSVVPPRDVARSLQQRVQARIERGASMLAVRLEGTNPWFVAATVNAIAQGFVDTARSLSISKHRELTATLRNQLDSAERRLRSAEASYTQYRVNTYTLPHDFAATPVAPGMQGGTDVALNSYSNMTVQRDALERDRAALEAALAASADSGLAVDQLAYVQSVTQSRDLSAALQLLTEKQTELNNLRVRYTEENPEVQRVAGQVTGLRMRTIPDLTRTLMVQLAIRGRELDRRIDAAGVELQQVPRRSTEEQRRRRQVDLASTQYQLLENQYQNAIFAEAAEEIGARVIDPAVVPSRPVKNTALMLLAAAIVGSLGTGVLFAVLLDFLDRRVRYPEQVSRDLGLPILGAVPRIRATDSRRGAVQMGTLQVVESLRGIRMALQHAHGVAGPMMVTITSPGPGEGKSFVASNLALAFADAGHRTILIDGDVRRGQLHRLLQGHRKPGLTDHLQGAIPREEAIQETRFPSLWFVGCGTRLHAAPELLASPAMGQLLLSLRGSYDVILVDSPPLGAGVDPYVLATATSNLLFVLRTGVTDRELAEAKLDMIDRLPIRILGAVLNDVQRGAAFRYYGYEHYYLDSYETRSEEDEEAAEGAAEIRAADV